MPYFIMLWLASMSASPRRSRSILAGELSNVKVEALPDAVMFTATGPDGERHFAELSVADGVNLYLGLADCLTAAMGADRRGDSPRPRPAELA